MKGYNIKDYCFATDLIGKVSSLGKQINVQTLHGPLENKRKKTSKKYGNSSQRGPRVAYEYMQKKCSISLVEKCKLKNMLTLLL